jgi:hypothetical protein
MTRRSRKAKAPQKVSHKGRQTARRTKPGRREPPDDSIAAAAQALDLKIDKSWMPAVRGHLQVTLGHAALVADFALPDDAEPAPVFWA